MKQVLIIADLLHSRNRVFNLTKHLREFNWNPTILAPEGQQCEYAEVIETTGYCSPYGKRKVTSPKLQWIRPLLKRLYKFVKEITQYPDNQTKWIPYALETANTLFQTHHFDAIISTSSPVSSHTIAKTLKRKHSIPWIGDFRDPWTQNPNYPYTRLRRWRERKLELETMRTADAMVDISPASAVELGKMHKRKEVYSILNSYDPDEYDIDTPLTQKFSITFTGQIYEKEELAKFLAGLNEFLMAHQGIRLSNGMDVNFYGPIDPSKLPSFIKYHGVIPRSEIPARQKESHVLLHLKWNVDDLGIIGGKFFEYLGAKRPILAVGGRPDSVSFILEETGAGVEAPTVEDVATQLEVFYNQYRSFGEAMYHGNGEIAKYTAWEMTRQYSEVLNQVSQ